MPDELAAPSSFVPEQFKQAGVAFGLAAVQIYRRKYDSKPLIIKLKQFIKP